MMGSRGSPCNKSEQAKDSLAEALDASPRTVKKARDSRLGYKPLVATSLAQQIAEQLRKLIVDGTLEPNSRLPTEADLSEQFKVSRPTVREALKRLATQNLIFSRRGPTGGTFVNKPSYENLCSDMIALSSLLLSSGATDASDMMEARRVFGAVCGRLAAKRRNGDDLKHMQMQLRIIKRADVSEADFADAVEGLFRAMVNATHNKAMQFAMSAVIDALGSSNIISAIYVRERSEIARLNAEIYDAIYDKNSVATETTVSDLGKFIMDRINLSLGWSYVGKLANREVGSPPNALTQG